MLDRGEKSAAGHLLVSVRVATGGPAYQHAVRLAETQHIIALARMNDGAVFMARQEIIVTIGGCGG